MPSVQRLVAWLQANVPAEDASIPAPAVVHGDFRLDNLVCDEQLQVRLSFSQQNRRIFIVYV
jgi:aminoglycoside phosphotransferase (APT) family kinase protein